MQCEALCGTYVGLYEEKQTKYYEILYLIFIVPIFHDVTLSHYSNLTLKL